MTVTGWDNFDNLTDYQKAGACLTMISATILFVVVVMRVYSGYTKFTKFNYKNFLGLGSEKSGVHTIFYALVFGLVFTGALSFYKEDNVM